MDLSTLALFAAALFVNAGSPGPGILALVARVTALLVMMVVDLGWAGAAAWARRWLRTPGAQRIANRVGATAMGGAAAAVATR